MRPDTVHKYYPYFFVTLTPLILLAPFLVGAQMLYWGTPLLQFYPWRLVALESVQAGYLPLWNPWVGNGAPLAANYQSALFYPPNWLSLVIPLDLSLNWLMVLHIIWAGVGMVKLARSLGYSSLGQAVAGLAFGMGQYVVARASFYSINAAVAWLPWVIWAADQLLIENLRLTSSRFAFHVLRFSAILALQLLTGHAQTTWYTYLLLAAWVLWRTLYYSRAQSPSINALILKFSLLALSFVLAILLASIQLLPTFELLQQSPRAEAAEYEFVMTYSFSPWRLLTFLAADFLGNPARGQFYGYGNYLEDAVYVGLIPVLFALAAVPKIFRRSASNSHNQSSTPLILFLLILPVTLILALGRNTPIFPWVYANVPTFDMFQAPTRMMVWFVFALALLGGWGVGQWAVPQGRGLYWARLGTAGAVALMGTALAMLFSVDADTRMGQLLGTVASASFVLGINLLAVGLLSLLKPSGPSFKWELAVVVCLAADLLYANFGIHPPAPADLYRASTASGRVLAAELGDQRLYQFPADRDRVMFEPYFSFLTYGNSMDLSVGAREVQLPNVGVLDDMASAYNFDPLVSQYYKGFTDVVSQTQSTNLLNLMNVGVVASSKQLPWKVIASAREVAFYRVPGESKRLWLIPENGVIEVADEAASRAAISAPAFSPTQQVVLELSDVGSLASAPISAPIASNNPNGFSISLNLHQANWVVLADTWYPGWYAYIDGQPAALRRANYAFRAVWVPAGAHRVEFLYSPPSFQLGATLTVVGLLISLSLAAWLAWRRNFASAKHLP